MHINPFFNCSDLVVSTTVCGGLLSLGIILCIIFCSTKTWSAHCIKGCRDVVYTCCRQKNQRKKPLQKYAESCADEVRDDNDRNLRTSSGVTSDPDETSAKAFAHTLRCQRVSVEASHLDFSERGCPIYMQNVASKSNKMQKIERKSRK